jgi:hypothetical protein
LEKPSLWLDFQIELITAIRAALTAAVGPRDRVRIEERVYLEVTDAASRKVVTVIEVLSRADKVSGSQGLKSFRRKRDTIMRLSSHWVEIDLPRCGVSLALRQRIRPHEDFVPISPVRLRAEGLVWPIRLSQRRPVIRIPLRAAEKTPLDLQAVLETASDRGDNQTEIDCAQELEPPLSKEWRQWADCSLGGKGLRRPAATG